MCTSNTARSAHGTGWAHHGSRKGSTATRSAIIPFILVDSMLRDALLDSLFQFRSLEQGLFVRNTGDSLVRLKDLLGHAHVDVHAGFDVESQTTKHDGDQATSTRAGDQIEVFAGFGDLISFGRLSFGLDVCSVHEFLQDDQHGVTANTTAIERQYAQGRSLGGVLSANTEGVHCGATPLEIVVGVPVGGCMLLEKVRT